MNKDNINPLLDVLLKMKQIKSNVGDLVHNGLSAQELHSVELESLMGNSSKANLFPAQLSFSLQADLLKKKSMPNVKSEVSMAMWNHDLNLEEDVEDIILEPSNEEKLPVKKKRFKKKKKDIFNDLLPDYVNEKRDENSAMAESKEGETNEGSDSSEDNSSSVSREFPSPMPPAGTIDEQDETFEKVFVCESRSKFPPKSHPDSPILELPPLKNKCWPVNSASSLALPIALEYLASVDKRGSSKVSRSPDNQGPSQMRESGLKDGNYDIDLEKKNDEKLSIKKESRSLTLPPIQPLLCSDTYVFVMNYPKTNVSRSHLTLKCNEFDTLSKFKDKLSVVFDKPIYLIELTQNNEALEDAKPFTCFINNTKPSPKQLPEEMIQARIRHSLYSRIEEDKLLNISFEPMPTRKITTKQSISIEKCKQPKFYMGGFVDNVNCKIFHNASSQTFEKNSLCELYKMRVGRKDKYSQTFSLRNLCMQTPRDTSTQMTGVGVYRSMKNDKTLGPSGLEIDFMANLKSSIITVQSYIRRWFSRRIVEARLGMNLCIEYTSKEEKEENNSDAQINSSLFNRRLHPKTKDDFDLLYLDLEVWRLKELREITLQMKGAERKAALTRLLNEESMLIRCIGRIQLELRDHHLARQFRDFIDKASKPKLVRSLNSSLLIIDSWFKLHSRHLHTHYKTLEQNTSFLSNDDERLPALGVVKKYLDTVQHDDLIEMKLELLEMIEREATLTLKGIPRIRLLALRKRVNHMFQMLLRKPQFNPAIAHYQENLLSNSHNYIIVFCNSCHRNLPVNKFPLTTNSASYVSVKLCEDCHRTNNRACKRSDISIYTAMLSRLQKDEREFDDGARTAFLIQVKDLEYLVNCVWQMRSVISKDANLRDLVFVRWRTEIEWSPWNCLLLTNDESYLHKRNCVSFEEAYSEELISNVELKHTRARNDFRKLKRYLSSFQFLPGFVRKKQQEEFSPRNGPNQFSRKRADGTDALFCADIKLLG